MGTHDIDEKACPACAAVIGREAERCSCGHLLVESDQSDEELYEAYLAARVEQNLEALEQARAALRALPGDYARALRVLEQVHELRMLQRELERQRAPAEADLPPQAVNHGFATPTDAFRVAQARRAEAIARRLSERACPACDARLGAAATRCDACGHAVPQNSAPPPSMRSDPAFRDPD